VKLIVKIGLCFICVVLVFGAVMILLNQNSVQREKTNTTKMYEERGLSIAKAIDASVTTGAQLLQIAQSMVDKATKSNIGIFEFTICAEAPKGQSASGYWNIGSSNYALVGQSSTPEDIAAINQNKYNVLYAVEKNVKIIQVTYPLHDYAGVPVATAKIKFDMSEVDKMMVPSSTYIYTILMIVISLLVAGFLSYSITKPIKQLTDVANKVSTGDMTAKMPEIKSNDEIGELAKSFGRMVASIKIMMMDKEE
jgi:HAMP domain-containing protein